MTEAVQQIRDLMQEYGITVDDLQSTRKKNAAKKSGTAQFHNSQTGDSWSGHGRMPNWLARTRNSSGCDAKGRYVT